jgi:hypothetical protein
LSQFTPVRSRPSSRSVDASIVVLFGLTSFIAAALLFSVQPMIGKMVLPVLGGTPAVWNTCLVYFQVTLFLGYLFTHGVSQNAETRRRRISGIYLLLFAVLLVLGYLLQPILIQAGDRPGSTAAGYPALGLLGILGRSATLPLVMVSATAPLLQCWFSLTPHPRARDPFFLYAASNAGSLLALLAYPLLIEPNMGLNLQSKSWQAGYLLLAILILICGVTARLLNGVQANRITADDSNATFGVGRELAPASSFSPVTRSLRLGWLVLVFVPSSWLMGVTTYLTTDLAAIPLLWTIPLALYLLSFILAFSRSGSRAVRAATRLLPFAIMPLVLVMSAGFVHAVWIPLHLIAFFLGCVTCHGALAEARPAAHLASTFYLTIAAGGLLGGVFAVLIAPVVFNRVVEYPLAMVLACLVVPAFKSYLRSGAIAEWIKDCFLPGAVFLLTLILATNQAGLADSILGVLAVMVASGLGILACLTANHRPVRFALTAAAVLAASSFSAGASGQLLHAERSFFGMLRVTYDPERNAHRLFHGTTLHGQQSLLPLSSRQPSTYFTRSGPIGQVFAVLGPHLDQPSACVAVVGLGAGTLACYARPGQSWTFYEIDPAVSRIARDPRYFTYLRDCDAESTNVITGDARLRLREAPDHGYRLIVLDAFSSDSLPVHLVSREAIQLYRSKLADGGVLAFNLSNRYLDLDPVMGRQAADAGLVCLISYDTVVSAEEKRAGKQPSIWAVMAETERGLGSLVSDARWRRARSRPGASVWTDDYSDLLSAIHWLSR